MQTRPQGTMRRCKGWLWAATGWGPACACYRWAPRWRSAPNGDRAQAQGAYQAEVVVR